MKSVILTLISLFICLHTQAQQTAKMTPFGRGYLEYLPENYSNSSNTYPVIIFLHGAGERGNGSPADLQKVTKQGPPQYIKDGHNMCFTWQGQSDCFIVLSPQQSSSRWGWTGDVMPFISWAAQNYRIDPERIYVTGLSMGGEGAWVTSYDPANDPNMIAAIAPVAGKGDYNQAKITATRRIYVWAFHGSNDTAIPVSDGQRPINGMNSVNPDPAPIFTLVNGGGHNSTMWHHVYRTDNTNYSPNLYQWFLSKTRLSGAPANPNQPPLANAGTDQSITLPVNSVSLNGSGVDSDGTIAPYLWTQVSGPNTATLSGTNSPTITASNLIEGTYIFRLLVSDDDGASSSDEISIDVISLTQPPASGSITWMNIVGSQVIDGNLTKTASYGSSAGASSAEVLSSGADGWFEFQVNGSGKTFTVGLNDQDIDASVEDIDYGIQISSNNNNVFIYEKGVKITYAHNYISGDSYRIERVSSTIQYKRNGVVFYTSAVPSTSALIVDASLLHTGAIIEEVEISFHSSAERTRINTPYAETITTISESGDPLVRVYPNPAKTTLTIDLPEWMLQTVRVKIISDSGQVEYDQIVERQRSIELLIDRLAPGVKLISVSDGEFTSNTKIIKRN